MNKVITLILSLSLLCTACDGRRVQDLLFVYTLGIDYKEGKYEVYAQINNFGSIAGGDMSGPPQETNNLWIGKATDPILENAFYKLRSSSNTMTYSHLTSIILGPGILHDRKVPILDHIIRSRTTRLTPWLFATDDPMDKILTSKPFSTQTPYFAIYSQPYRTYQQDSFVPPIRLHRLFSRLHEPDNITIIPTLQLVKKIWKNEQKDLPQLRISGAYATSKTQPTRPFTLNELKGIRWVNEETVDTPVYLKTKKQKTIVVTARKPKYKLQTKRKANGHAYYHIDIDVNAEVIHMYAPATPEELRNMVGKEITKEVKNTFEAGAKYNLDLLKLRYQTYQKNPHLWKKITKNPLSQDTVTVDVNAEIINTGFIKDETLSE